MSWRSFAQQAGLGRLWLHCWHRPAGALRKSIRAGGPWEQWIDARGRDAMQRAAESLPATHGETAENWPELHFLTGRKFWYQTAFCLHTLQSHTGRIPRAVFHDDGTLDSATAATLQRLFPHARIRTQGENDARLDRLLPADRFPALQQERRRPHPNMLKLTDVHAGERGWRLVLDSDMLFFRRPDFLIEWLERPRCPVYLTDFADAYHYSYPLMQRLAGAPIPPRINVGILGLRSDSIDWAALEAWCAEMIEREGTHYYIEQALSAMLCAQQAGGPAPTGDYLVMPSEAECRTPTAVLHHYVADSKRGYFRHAWPIAAQRAAQAAGAAVEMRPR